MLSSAQGKIEQVKNMFLSGRIRNYRDVKSLLGTVMSKYYDDTVPQKKIKIEDNSNPTNLFQAIKNEEQEEQTKKMQQ